MPCSPTQRRPARRRAGADDDGDRHHSGRRSELRVDRPPPAAYPARPARVRARHEGDGARTFFVAIEDGRVIGTVALEEHRLRAMAVDTQTRGVGRLLVARLEQEARARGIARIELHARGTARGFYAKLWLRRGRRDFHRGDDPAHRDVEDALSLRVAVSRPSRSSSSGRADGGRSRRVGRRSALPRTKSSARSFSSGR